MLTILCNVSVSEEAYQEYESLRKKLGEEHLLRNFAEKKIGEVNLLLAGLYKITWSYCCQPDMGVILGSGGHTLKFYYKAFFM